MKSHISSKCEICFEEFDDKSTLKLHKQATHVKVKNLTCEFCLKDFTDKSNLKRHKKNTHKIVNDTRRVNNNDNKTESIHKKNNLVSSSVDYNCAPCQKRFSNKSNLVKHMKLPDHGLKEEGIHEIKCKKCMKVFAVRNGCDKLLYTFLEYEHNLYLKL